MADPVTLDFSKAEPIKSEVALDFSKAERVQPTEQTIQMYPNGKPNQVENVPVSQFREKQKEGYYPALSDEDKKRINADSISPVSPVSAVDVLRGAAGSGAQKLVSPLVKTLGQVGRTADDEYERTKGRLIDSQ